MKMIKYLIGFLIVFSAHAYTPISSVNESKQLLVVTNLNAQNTQATLQRYERDNDQQKWQPVGNSMVVVVGKKGIAQNKKEGDASAPTGIFSLGTAFGFAAKPDFKTKLAYLPITQNTVCVDDGKSPYYNQIIDSSKVSKSTWNSGEIMQQEVPQYTWGLVVNYNLPQATPGAGSCIFMHVWKNAETGTAGCVAMSETDMKQVLTWLDPAKNPLLVIAPLNTYRELQKSAQLPEIPG